MDEINKNFDWRKVLLTYNLLRGPRVGIEGKIDKLMLTIGAWNSESFKEFVSLMEQKGFTALSYDTEDINKEGVLHVLDQLAYHTTEDSDLIFFYEGHGGVSPLEEEGSYIVLNGPSRFGEISGYTGNFDFIRPSELKPRFDKIPKKRLAVIVASCFNIEYHDVFSDENTVVLTAASHRDPFSHYYNIGDYYTRDRFTQELIFALESSRHVNLLSLQRFSWWDKLKYAFAFSPKKGPLRGTISGNMDYVV